MPEGPEVREFYLYMKNYLIDNTINKLVILSGKYLKNPPRYIENVCNVKVKNIFVKGKTIFIEFHNILDNISETAKAISFVHGMTGNWSDTEVKHSRIFFDLKIGKLYYNDTRNFGLINIYKTEAEFEKAQDHLGPDVLSDTITYDEFYSRLNKKPRSKLGVILLNQQILSGIGNYLRCDIIWYIRKICGFKNIKHTTLIKDLSDKEKLYLYEVSTTICRYRAGKLLKKVFDQKNNFLPLDDFYVYGRDYDMFGNKVIREKFCGRTIHYTA